MQRFISIQLPNGKRDSISSRELEISFAVEPLGEKAVLLRFGDQISDKLYSQVALVKKALEDHQIIGWTECVPAYCTLTVYYNPLAVWRSRSEREQQDNTIFDTVCTRIAAALQYNLVDQIQQSHSELGNQRSGILEKGINETGMFELPVCYGAEFGPDLSFASKHCKRGEQEIVAIHSATVYSVYMIGFTPGFPYLGGLPESLVLPRRAVPRMSIEAGSVGIAGSQTGIYPQATPGGWQIIGRTPVLLFDADRRPPSLLSPGMKLKFRPIEKQEYYSILECPRQQMDYWREAEKWH